LLLGNTMTAIKGPFEREAKRAGNRSDQRSYSPRKEGDDASFLTDDYVNGVGLLKAARGKGWPKGNWENETKEQHKRASRKKGRTLRGMTCKEKKRYKPC